MIARQSRIVKNLEKLGSPGEPVIFMNPHSTRSKTVGRHILTTLRSHPYFAGASLMATTAASAEGVRRLRDHIRDGRPRVVVPVGGDGTFRAAMEAVEGTQSVLCATGAGNGCNAAMNLLRDFTGNIVPPHEAVERGHVTSFLPLVMQSESTRRLASTVADIGMLSTGAHAISTYLRRVPGYTHDTIRSFFHERLLLVGRTALCRPYGVIERYADGTSEDRTQLTQVFANAPHIGHYGRFPQVSLGEPGAFVSVLHTHRELLPYARAIQSGTLPGTMLLPEQPLVLTPDRTVRGSVDGEAFVVEKGEATTVSIGTIPINVIAA